MSWIDDAKNKASEQKHQEEELIRLQLEAKIKTEKQQRIDTINKFHQITDQKRSEIIKILELTKGQGLIIVEREGQIHKYSEDQGNLMNEYHSNGDWSGAPDYCSWQEVYGIEWQIIDPLGRILIISLGLQNLEFPIIAAYAGYYKGFDKFPWEKKIDTSEIETVIKEWLVLIYSSDLKQEKKIEVNTELKQKKGIWPFNIFS